VEEPENALQRPAKDYTRTGLDSCPSDDLNQGHGSEALDVTTWAPLLE
jgi:hypothetical protein